MSKKNRTVTLEDETWNLLNEIQSKNNLRSNSAAIEFLVNNSLHDNNEQLATMIVEAINKKYSNLFTRIRLGANGAERTCQILLEVLNSMVVGLSLSDYVSTEVMESDIVKESRENVKERITRLKQIKDNGTINSTQE